MHTNETFASKSFVGVPVEVNEKLIRVVGGHLAYKSYGSYAGIFDDAC